MRALLSSAALALAIMAATAAEPYKHGPDSERQAGHGPRWAGVARPAQVVLPTGGAQPNGPAVRAREAVT